MDTIDALLKKTTKKTVWWTVQLLFLVIGGRPAFYDDADAGGFNAMPATYKAAFIRVCEAHEIAILFHEGRFVAVNTRHPKLPKRWWDLRTDSSFGSLLGFPCSARALGLPQEKSYAVWVDVHTEHGKVGLFGFACSLSELSKIKRWFYSIRSHIMKLATFFKDFRFSAEIHRFTVKGGKTVDIAPPILLT
jgi:hypothetical protein